MSAPLSVARLDVLSYARLIVFLLTQNKLNKDAGMEFSHSFFMYQTALRTQKILKYLLSKLFLWCLTGIPLAQNKWLSPQYHILIGNTSNKGSRDIISKGKWNKWRTFDQVYHLFSPSVSATFCMQIGVVRPCVFVVGGVVFALQSLSFLKSPFPRSKRVFEQSGPHINEVTAEVPQSWMLL